MKDIKDYIHYYIGCQYWLCNDTEGIPVTQEITPHFIREIEKFNIRGKPILTRLSDLTKHDLSKLYEVPDYIDIVNVKKEAGKTIWYCKWVDIDESLNSSDGFSYTTLRLYHKSALFTATKFNYLLKMGYDVFQLIESECAIDKNDPILKQK